MFKLLIFLAFILFTNIICRECYHGKDEVTKASYKKMYKDIFSTENRLKAQTNRRNLQNQVPQPLRVTFDLSTIDKNVPQQLKDYLQKLCNVVSSYFSYLIKVIPQTSNNRLQGEDSKCIEVIIPQNDIEKGIPNSDLHIYVIAVMHEDKDFVAGAIPCSFNYKMYRPNFGRVQFNLKFFSENENELNSFYKFNQNLQVLIHEITHILGFSLYSFSTFINPDTGQPYGSNDQIVIEQLIGNDNMIHMITSKNVVKVARKYYNCPTIKGMILEDQGTTGTAGSHWEKAILYDELMNGKSESTGAYLSVFTIALLKDTGYYADVNENFGENIYWGRNKGCDFFENNCTGNQKYKEFSYVEEQKCNFKNNAYGSSKSYKSNFTNGCLIVGMRDPTLCNDSDQGQDDTKYQSFSTNSRCFESNVSPKKFNIVGKFRCLEAQCAPDFSSITIKIKQINKTFVCAKPNQILGIMPVDGKGNITCPSNFREFCEFNPICKNYCSQNGICVRGQCICQNGWAGEDCSQQCSKYIENNQCVNQCSFGNFASLDNQCRPTCFKGFYKNKGVCSQCHSSCSECTGPSPNECTACQFLTYLNENRCVETCPESTVAIEQTKTCQPCPKGCLTCNSSTQCTQCDSSSNFVLNSSGLCDQISKCDSNCYACTKIPTQCIKCSQGLFLNPISQRCVKESDCPPATWINRENNECTICSIEGCLKCINDTTCEFCNSALGYRKQNLACSNCVSPCLTCQSNNPSSCRSCDSPSLILYNSQCVNSCPNGTYLETQTNTCQPCQPNCLQCKNEDKCITCDTSNGYNITLSGKCEKQCAGFCLTCLKDNKSYCKNCIRGYYFYNNSCYQQCPINTYYNINTKKCEECSVGCQQCNSVEQCTVCDESAGYRLLQDQCVFRDACDLPCKTCVPFQSTTCLSCVDKYYLYAGGCFIRCPNNKKPINGVC